MQNQFCRAAVAARLLVFTPTVVARLLVFKAVIDLRAGNKGKSKGHKACCSEIQLFFLNKSSFDCCKTSISRILKKWIFSFCQHSFMVEIFGGSYSIIPEVPPYHKFCNILLALFLFFHILKFLGITGDWDLSAYEALMISVHTCERPRNISSVLKHVL